MQSSKRRLTSSLHCHGWYCPRRYVYARDLPAGADEFYYSDSLDSWICPECGGTDVH